MIDFTSRKMKISLDFPEKKLMKCPLCGMGHPMYVNGYVRDYHTNEHTIHPNKGFSFCNCKNIWYNSWDNINQDEYDETERTKTTNEAAKNNKRFTFWKIVNNLTDYKKDINTFLNIGGGSFYIEDMIKEHLGWHTTSVDINNSLESKGHKFINKNIEEKGVIESLGKYDVIWMSHVIEHLKHPLKTLKELKKCLNPGGLLYVAMPDPFFFNPARPHSWGHWWLHQHYIMWDMDNFGFELFDMGYIVKLTIHNPNPTIKEFYMISSNPIPREERFMELTKDKRTATVPIDLIDPNDIGHNIDNIDKEHRKGAKAVKKLIKEGKRILPIAVNYYGKRLDGFKRYVAFKELGYKEIDIVKGREGGCQHNQPWVMSSKS